MRSRNFEFRASGVRGLPAALLIALGVVGIAALVALVLFVGAAFVATALVASAGLALWHGVRRKLGMTPAQQPQVSSYDARPFFEDVPPAAMPPSPGSTLTEAREIEVEVLPKQ